MCPLAQAETGLLELPVRLCVACLRIFPGVSAPLLGLNDMRGRIHPSVRASGANPGMMYASKSGVAIHEDNLVEAE